MATTSTTQPIEPTLERARAAFDERRWPEAFELLRESDGHRPLSAHDLERLGEAAWWVGRLAETIAVRERAYTAHMASGDRCSAAGVALALANDYSHRSESAIASGWIRRGERLLADLPESPEHGWLERARLNTALSRGDLDGALASADRLLELADRLRSADLEALGLQDRGRVLVAMGRVEEGMALLDEAVVAAVSGDVSPYPTAVVYCNATVACQDLTDYRRAGEFAEAARRWCERQAIAGFPGMCRVRRVEMIRLRGAWDEAEREARQACAELQDFCLDYAGEGFYQIGEIRLRLGDLPGAEEAFTQAHGLGRDPLPGMALLRLAQGQARAAASVLSRALSDPSLLPLTRARLLPAQVDVALALPDRGLAADAAAELDTLASRYGTHVMRAAAADARGVVALASGEVETAINQHRTAWRLWQEIDAPYEAARARRALGEALLADGDRAAAELELNAAAAAFARLGARLDLERTNAVLRDGGTARRHGARRPETARRTFMFTDIVRSTKLIEAVGDEAWGELLAWHDETIRALLREHGGEEVHHAGDGFFVAFASADAAVRCAVAIRRRLAEQRQRHGFAPAIRIGLHADEALQTSGGYEGRGVHVAARVGARAKGDEILVTDATLALLAQPPEHTELRSVRLRGITQPVKVARLTT